MASLPYNLQLRLNNWFRQALNYEANYTYNSMKYPAHTLDERTFFRKKECVRVAELLGVFG